jgi:uncharacterized protein (TIGR00255 family)
VSPGCAAGSRSASPRFAPRSDRSRASWSRRSLYVDRRDITEETVRLRSHLEQFRETLDAAGAVGRKLEFVLQELGRETNTIGSKSGDTLLTRTVVELKTELEKLREQALNIE